jgi:hypothetical protein
MIQLGRFPPCVLADVPVDKRTATKARGNRLVICER